MNNKRPLHKMRNKGGTKVPAREPGRKGHHVELDDMTPEQYAAKQFMEEVEKPQSAEDLDKKMLDDFRKGRR
jgi:hypothetical protein